MTDVTEKPVIIFVRGEQYYDGADPDETELMTEGFMTIDRDGTILLEYEETELTGMEGTTTRFAVQNDKVTLTRTGGINSQMVFQRGRRHSSLYETPWGTMLVDIATTALAYRLNDRGGVLDIKYTIAVDHQVTGRNQFKIRVKEVTR